MLIRVLAVLTTLAASAANAQPRAAAVGHDLSGAVTQSAVDKLVAAPSYPLVVFDKNVPFQGLLRGALPGEVFLEDDKVDALLDKAAKYATGPGKPIAGLPEEDQVLRSIAAEASGIIHDVEALLASPSAASRDPELRKELQKIVDGGIPKLRTTLRGFPIKVHVSHIAVTVREKPDLKLSVPTSNLQKLNISLAATPELWIYHPVPTWDWPWNWPSRWDRVIAVPVSVPLDVAAQVNLTTEGTHVFASGTLKELKIPIPVIGLINFAGLANLFLRDLKVDLYDASQLLVTVPVMEKTFTISGILLRQPVGATGLEVLVEVKALRAAQEVATASK